MRDKLLAVGAILVCGLGVCVAAALDQATEIEKLVVSPIPQLVKVKINRGILEETSKARQVTTYSVKNRSPQAQTVSVEHRRSQGFILLSPEKPVEQTGDVYRFDLPVKAGEVAKLEVIEERETARLTALGNAEDRAIRAIVTSPVAGPKVKDALAKVLELKAKIAERQRELANETRRLADLTGDQARLRAVLKEVPPTSAAYKRYLEKFDQQETEIDQGRDRIKKLQDLDVQQRRTFDEYLAYLSVD